MVKINSFKSLRPVATLVEKVATRAYSNYSKEEIKLEIQKNKYSFLNVIGSNNSENAEARFKAIKSKINEFKTKGILEKDRTESVYIYKQSKNKITYTGLICGINLEDYENQRIKIHEKTIKNRELLFSKYLSHTKIHAEPVLLTHEEKLQYIKKENMCPEKKIYDFRSFDNTQHEVWQISSPKEIQKISRQFEKIKNLYIADGHHRMASSFRYNKKSKCLAYILPTEELKTYAFHRVVNCNEQIFRDIKNKLKFKKINIPKTKSKMIQCYMKKKWYEIIDTTKNKDTIDTLLVSKLVQHILIPVFNIKNERNNKNVRFLPGLKSLKNLTKQIKEREILFLMNRIHIETIIEIAKKNKTTPPKSTFILPKIPSGLIMMELK